MDKNLHEEPQKEGIKWNTNSKKSREIT